MSNATHPSLKNTRADPSTELAKHRLLIALRANAQSLMQSSRALEQYAAMLEASSTSSANVGSALFVSDLASFSIPGFPSLPLPTSQAVAGPGYITLPSHTTNRSASPKPVATTAKPKVKKIKDPNAPKRPMTSFFLFQSQNRKEVEQRYPDMTPNEVSKELGKQWGLMTPENKEYWKGLAENKRQEYEAAMRTYVKEKKSEVVDSMDTTTDHSSVDSPALSTFALPLPGRRSSTVTLNPDVSGSTSGSSLGSLSRGSIIPVDDEDEKDELTQEY